MSRNLVRGVTQIYYYFDCHSKECVVVLRVKCQFSEYLVSNRGAGEAGGFVGVVDWLEERVKLVDLLEELAKLVNLLEELVKLVDLLEKQPKLSLIHI